jgi:glycosyltransferase involved in cell wall biosynthesis
VIIHQFVPMLEPGAVGDHALLARAALRAQGHTSEIFTAQIHPASAGAGARLTRDYRGGGDVLVYQMAIGSVVADAVLERDEPLVVNHHNLTPLRYFAGWEPVAAHGVVWGRGQLREFAERGALGIAVSNYNERDLHEAGFARTAVIPVLFDPRRFDCEPDPRVRRSGPTTWLFVGRLAPNKAQHDIVKALAAYRRFHDPGAGLVLVGGGADSAYGRTLRRYVHALDLDDAVTITGAVPEATLAAYYRTADIFVSCSEHEGFCVPLLEAMHHRLPVVAYAAAAIPETLGEAGVALATKDPCTVAAAVERVVRDAALRATLIDRGTARVRVFDPDRSAAQFVAAVTAVAA